MPRQSMRAISFIVALTRIWLFVTYVFRNALIISPLGIVLYLSEGPTRPEGYMGFQIICNPIFARIYEGLHDRDHYFVANYLRKKI